MRTGDLYQVASSDQRYVFNALLLCSEKLSVKKVTSGCRDYSYLVRFNDVRVD